MKYGIREICDVVLRAKATQMLGNKKFYRGEPVCYFDTLKTSSLEGAATTVYAQGGRGNSRLVAWDGERTLTFTMEDALISPEGLMLLTGAGLVEATTNKPLKVHVTERIEVPVDYTDATGITLSNKVYTDDATDAYVMILDERGEVKTEPYLFKKGTSDNVIVLKGDADDYAADTDKPKANDIVLVDYYALKSNAKQIEIEADKFSGNYYLEASTLFRNTDGVDLPAEFIIPNCKIQSNFTFTMASSGDPSTFTFTMDAFPDYTRFDKTKKVLAAIQVIEDEDGSANEERVATKWDFSQAQ